MKKATAVLFAIIFIFTAFWIGEAGKGLFQIFLYIIGFVGIVAISYFASNNLKYRTISAITFIILFSAAFYIGDLSFYRAYNSCIGDAENIRTTLIEFKTKNGKYPSSLGELNMPLPCSRCLRGSILEYKSNGSNYKIWFKDWLIEHSATDKEPFTAYK